MDSNVYSLNSSGVTRSPVTPEEHHKFLNLALIIVCLAIILGLSYWWYAVQQPQVTPIAKEVDIRLQIATILRDASVQKVSAEEVDRIATQLRNTKSTVTSEERAGIANSLRGINTSVGN